MWAGPFCVEFAFSPCVCVGVLQVLCLPLKRHLWHNCRLIRSQVIIMYILRYNLLSILCGPRGTEDSFSALLLCRWHLLLISITIRSSCRETTRAAHSAVSVWAEVMSYLSSLLSSLCCVRAIAAVAEGEVFLLTFCFHIQLCRSDWNPNAKSRCRIMAALQIAHYLASMGDNSSACLARHNTHSSHTHHANIYPHK